MSSSVIINCLLCRKDILDDDLTIRVQEKGLRTIKAKSLKKKDHVRRSVTVNDVKEKTFHLICYNSYRLDTGTVNKDFTSENLSKRRSESLHSAKPEAKPQFTFSKSCLICGSEALDYSDAKQKKLNVNRRTKITHVTLNITGTLTFNYFY